MIWLITAGTLTKAADLMIERVPKAFVRLLPTDSLSGDAYEKIEKSQLLELIITDSIPSKKNSKKVTVLSWCRFYLPTSMDGWHNKHINQFQNF